MKKDEFVFFPQLHIASGKASVFQESSSASGSDSGHIPYPISPANRRESHVPF